MFLTSNARITFVHIFRSSPIAYKTIITISNFLIISPDEFRQKNDKMYKIFTKNLNLVYTPMQHNRTKYIENDRPFDNRKVGGRSGVHVLCFIKAPIG